MQTTIATAETAEAHRVQLRDLLRREGRDEYRRHDYLSHEWQGQLCMEERHRRGTETEAVRTMSPTSVDLPPQPVLFVPELAKDMTEWRQKLIAWKYPLVDKFGKAPPSELPPPALHI